MTPSKFLLICPPGFEEEAQKELVLKAPQDSILSCLSITGGLEIETELSTGLELNRLLKIPSRILLRLQESKVRDLPKLYPWRDYLWDDSSEIEITCKKSRLINTSKIESTVKEALAKYFSDNPSKKKIIEQRSKVASPALYLRFEEDVFTLSIDTSAELLHKRYLTKEIGEAPIRENLASALLLSLKEFSTSELLIDPMCGSGTFIKEASLFFSESKRHFAFEYFPLFKNSPPKKARDEDSRGLFKSFKGFDLDSKMIESATQNNPHFNSVFEVRDLFLPINKKISASVIVNPPYNKRLKIFDRNFYKKLQKALEHNFDIDALGLIIPRDYIETIDQTHLVKKISFRNGGFPLYYLVFKYRKLPGG
jgi:putative N6-adenine-specific DNA methylase